MKSVATTVVDNGKVRLGAQGPVFRRPAIDKSGMRLALRSATLADAGTVRLGAQSPLFRQRSIADAGTVRLGAQGPIFRR